ncbi:MAG: leucine-rich repeat domain-containing protein [Mycoplasmoidaceae bacterium]
MKSKILKLSLIPTIVVPSVAIVTNCSIVEHLKIMPKQIDGSDWLGRISGYFVKDDDYEINTEDKTVTYWNMYELKAHNLVVPNYVMWQGSKYKVVLDEKAFQDCTDTLSGSVELNDFCDVIPARCFQNDDKITKIIFHTYPKEIHEAAFQECSDLATICVKKNGKIYYDWAIKLVTVRAFAFDGCPIEGNLIFGSDFQTFEPSAFAGASIKKIDLSMCNKIEEIPEDAFNACGLLKQVAFPSSIIRIGARAFSGCSVLEKITLPAQDMEFSKVGESAFSGCLLFRGFFYKVESVELRLTMKIVQEACFFNNKCLEPRSYLINNPFGSAREGTDSQLAKSLFEACSFTSWTFSIKKYIWLSPSVFAFNQDLRFLDFTSLEYNDNVPDSWKNNIGVGEVADVFAHGSKFGTIFVRKGFVTGSQHFDEWVEWFEKQGLHFDKTDYETPSLDHWNFQEQ